MRPLLLVFALVPGLAACLDEPSTAESAQGETVIDPPTSSVFCVNCTNSHVVGQPFEIYTEYQGTCKGLFGEYPCQLQDYTASATCSAPCTSTSGSFHGSGGIEVVPLTAGPMSIAVTLTNQVPAWGGETATHSSGGTINVGASYVPDRIDVTCKAGDYHLPCVTTAVNKAPIELKYTLYAGTKRLDPVDTGFVVESTLPGGLLLGDWYIGDSQGCDWLTPCVTSIVHLDATGRMGSLVGPTTSLDVEYGHRPYDSNELTNAHVAVPTIE